MPKPRLTLHVKQRMAQRGITEDDLWAALGRRTRTHPGNSGNIWVYGHAPGGRILKVCLTPDEQTVVTAVWPD
ncbi:hypothetical protein GCM10027589_05430 [Actinocorallia lasiicapitis]